MAHQKFDVPKTIKFSEREVEKLQTITDIRHFDSDAEAQRFCLNFTYALLEKNLLASTMARLLEDL